MEVLRITLHLKCKDAADLSGNLFKHILKAVTVIYADDYRCTVQDWNSPLTEFLPIRVSLVTYDPFLGTFDFISNCENTPSLNG